MLVVLHDATDELVDQVIEEYLAANEDLRESVKVFDHLPNDYRKVVAEDRLQIFRGLPEEMPADLASYRHMFLYLASQGLRYWGDSLDEKNPVYAGEQPTDDEGAFRIVTDGQYAANRYQYISKFKVKFTGSVFASPRTFLILDSSRKKDNHDPKQDPKTEALLASLTDDFWGETALISASSQKRLEHLLEEHDQTIPISTSTGTASKLRFGGFSAIEESLPSEVNPTYGVRLRTSVTLFERQL